MGNTKQSVTVIGLGPMGQAMAGAFLDRDYDVTVWNRTPSRADALVGRGAVRAPSVAEALAAHELVVLSLTDYDAMYATLEPASAALAGRTLVNLSSDTPEKAREAARWAAARGAVQLTGGVTVPPAGIGRAESSTFYSGPREVFDRHRAALEVITGRTDHRGEDPGLAALMYQIGMVMFWTSMLSYWQAIALAHANGLTAADILPHAVETAESLPGFLSFYAERIDAGRHVGDVDRLAMGTASVEHVLHTNADAGVDTTLPATVVELFRRGMDAGHTGDSFSSLVELMRKR
ncbi:NAD(P)-dependent oxidoreductase [Streptomyces sp. 3MP-14]|uniref:NAD(P)-dependent oxidoreductase n=1 Tax=Streptomyces mimosae TaxID=2586635 RepID=A0A5N5ZYM9_9ACTN|nr:MULTISPECIES: NAD(P)-binding domain-containing protein [Streptomyces]KAB8161597.1 NAD(P)-dependent oxidoreductase [Streptomyces mimosae]KAB8173466.1 NAD(P)-dependent oxidoreductase [Streptomyces sp. 3MP-14]